MISDDRRYKIVEEKEGELAHYGKKGMKWGVRNASKTSSAPKTSGKKWNEDQVKKGKDVLKALAVGGALAIGYSVAMSRWEAGADARLFKQLAPELIRRVGNVSVVDL